jgi:molecular chaperone GrpE
VTNAVPPEGDQEPVQEPVQEPGQESAAPAAEAPAPAAGPDAAALEDRWRRCMADLDNLRKRYARELARERDMERRRASAAWLPVLDNLELALVHGLADPAALVEGVSTVRDQALSVLRDLGYPRDDETGIAFDPARHEVVEVRDEPEADSGTVVDVVRPGYGTVAEQLRPAAVAVSKRG